MNEYSDDDWADSGPFCRHWSDPIDCEIECARCGHACSSHGDGACMAEGGRCKCDDFQEERPRDDNTIEQMTPDD